MAPTTKKASKDKSPFFETNRGRSGILSLWLVTNDRPRKASEGAETTQRETTFAPSVYSRGPTGNEIGTSSRRSDTICVCPIAFESTHNSTARALVDQRKELRNFPTPLARSGIGLLFDSSSFFPYSSCCIAVRSNPKNTSPFERDLGGIRWLLAHPSNRFFLLGAFMCFFLLPCYILLGALSDDVVATSDAEAFQSTAHVANILRNERLTEERTAAAAHTTRKEREREKKYKMVVVVVVVVFRYSKINQTAR